MNSTEFEGYSGIYLHDITFSNDIVLVIVLILLSAFALIFRLNVPLFGKMISNISAGEQRQSIFETTERDSFLFNTFMTFQTLLLCSIYIFSVAVKYKYFIKPDILTTLASIGILLIFLFIFYMFKKSLYALFGHIFAEKSAYRMIFTNYQALFCTWGIFLYIPVLWILLIGKYIFTAIAMMTISYLLFRAILVFRFIHIFFNKNTGLLFLSLYLCAQEIIPLVFLYEGLIYMYNIIEINNIWQ
ncbi:MAG: DUF4271 domain-containing protein [Tannerella sp.]|jgi:hypothetical protein|nr:DUF4271 domain-containing protein [Tannerella sp.]